MYVYHMGFRVLSALWRHCSFNRMELLLFCATIYASICRLAVSYKADRGVTTSECNLIWRDSSAIGGVDTIDFWGLIDLTRPDVDKTGRS